MIDDGAFQADLSDFFGELVNLRMGRMAEEQRDVSVGAEVDDVADLRFQFAVIVEIVVADLHRFVPTDGANPAGVFAASDETAVGADGAHGDHVGEYRQPDCG